MKTRVLTSVIGTPLVALCLYFSYINVFWAIFVGAICVIASYEMLGCTGLKRVLPIAIPTLLYSALVPLCSIFMKDSEIRFDLLYHAAIIYIFIMLFVGVLTHNATHSEKLLASVAANIYVTNSIASLILLRRLDHGVALIILVLLGSWITDIFALFSGMFFGKRKLSPIISPKKTVEGAIGGTIFCSIAYTVFALVYNAIYDAELSVIVFALIAIPIAVFSQFGDLAASALKRSYGIKDYGNLIPGHGGILDRIDSVMAVSVLMLLIQSIFSII